jgi:shikimate dehydrogenase
MTAKAGVIGWPIEHSLSPILHGHWLKQYGIDGTFEKIAARPEEFTDTITRLRAKGYAGVNVTVPHKEAAFALADSADVAAQIAGAANLLVFTDGKITAFNTDAFGLQHALREGLGGTLAGQSAVLLGAGGAARGALVALQAIETQKVYVLNRSSARAQSLVAELQPRLKTPLVAGGLGDWPEAARAAALMINATSAGMSGNPPLDLDLSLLNKAAAVCDIVYNPLETPLLKDAKARGHVVIDGLGMLMHQAAPSFEAFFGQWPDVTPVLRAELEQVLRARQ